MDRPKQRLIDSAVKILDDEVASNIENAKEQLPKDAHDDLKDMITEEDQVFEDDWNVTINYIIKNLLFQAEKTVIFDCIIKYLDTIIKEFDTLYSPSYKQVNNVTIKVFNFGFAEDNLISIFELMYPSGKRVEEFEKEGYYDIILYIIDKFMVPFKFLSETPKVPQIHMRRYLKFHRRNIDLAFVNFISWQAHTTKPHIFIKIYMTAVRDFFVSVRPTSSSKDKSEIDEFFKGFGKGPKTFKKKKRGTK